MFFALFCSCLFLFVLAGGYHYEKQWLFEQIQRFAVQKHADRKPKFQYCLPFVGKTCRSAWVLTAGFPNRNNDRVRKLEAQIRSSENVSFAINVRRNPKFLTRTSYAVAFLVEFILGNSERSPACTTLYVPHILFVHFVCFVQY